LTSTSNKKPRIDENKSVSSSPMEVDKPENSLTETNSKLPSDNELKTASKNELKDLIRRAKAELERRKTKQTSNDFQGLNTSELENELSRAEHSLKNFQTSNTTANNDNKSSNGGVIAASVGVVGALVISGVALAKSKFSNNKKK